MDGVYNMDMDMDIHRTQYAGTALDVGSDARGDRALEGKRVFSGRDGRRFRRMRLERRVRVGRPTESNRLPVSSAGPGEPCARAVGTDDGDASDRADSCVRVCACRWLGTAESGVSVDR